MRGYLEGLLGDCLPRRADRLPHRGHPQRRGARRLRAGHLAAGPRRLPDRPAAQPALHPRLLGLDPRPGGDHLAGDARPQARDRAHRAHLHAPPEVRGHAADPRLPLRARRGRRRPAAVAGRGRGGRRRADHARGSRAPGPADVPGRPRPHGARRADRAGAGDHAPRHDLHPGRRRQDDRLPQRRRLPGRLHGDHPRRRRPTATCCSTSPTPSRSWSRPPRRWASTRSARSTPASTRSPPSASSGTTATTPWPSRRGSRSPTSATTRPTPGSRTPASRWSGSPAPSWAPGAAARAA